MSLCQDRDFLIYRQRLILFSQDSICQKFVSLPLSDEYSYISLSAEQAEVHLFQVKKKYGQRLESLKNPFVHSSPLVESKLRRYAGNFESSFTLPKKLSFSEPKLDGNEKTIQSQKIKEAPSESALSSRFGAPQDLDMRMPKRHSVDIQPSSARRDSIGSESSDTKNYYFGKTASVAYVNFSVGGTGKQGLSEIEEGEEDEEVVGNSSVGSKDDHLLDDSMFEKLNHLDSAPTKASIPKQNVVTVPKDELKFPKLSITSIADKRVSALKFAKTNKLVSALTQLVVETNDSRNPFARDFSFFDGKSDANPLKLTMFLPFSSMEKIEITVKKDANVQEVIGYTLYEYVDREGHPPIPSSLYDSSLWSIRIAEDDGTIDDDFPALDRSRQIHKFGYDTFALCNSISFEEAMSKPESVGKESITDTSSTKESVRAADVPLSSSQAKFLKVHLYSTTEMRQTTTIHVPVHLKYKEVFSQLCQKYKYDPKEYILKLVDGMTDVPMEKTLDEVESSEFCVVKRIKNNAAGDILSSSKTSTEVVLPDFRAFSFSTVLKEYSVLVRGLMGKYERILSIDNDYFHLVSSSKHFFDRELGKTTSLPLSSIVSIKQSSRKRNLIKISVKMGKSNALKTYELEALSLEESDEIFKRLKSYS